jgi:hypothetical protein
MRPHPRRDEAIELRKQGLSYREINQQTGIARSTLSYLLRDIILTDEQQSRLHSKLGEGAQQVNAAMSKERKIEIGVRSGKKAWAERREQLLDNLARGKIRPHGTKRTKFSEYFPDLKTEATGEYRWVIVRGHPMADNRGRILEHRYVMSQQLGRLLLDSELVHHKDENKLNNHPDNLELLSGEAEHKQRHYPNARVIIKCANCETEVIRNRRFVGRGKNDFCSHSCASLFYKGPKRPTTAVHGTNSMYHLKCRCPDCKFAHAAYTKEYRHNKQLQNIK